MLSLRYLLINHFLPKLNFFKLEIFSRSIHETAFQIHPWVISPEVINSTQLHLSKTFSRHSQWQHIWFAIHVHAVKSWAVRTCANVSSCWRMKTKGTYLFTKIQYLNSSPFYLLRESMVLVWDLMTTLWPAATTRWWVCLWLSPT